ncbi:tRNA 2-selenouridine synthase [Oceaniovalibus guishaninsula JLT2003]|uniref:tRNA 2-selenouridine synthase n=1 Tax=Oceaniovalibus guishaninsula JLT2003 TaxID=1231392 RepID=K2HCD6_9RHOB|nr:tRNA 2-selenouridine(34) synthase MnmH [Oceaniovalibus guishaninsula]EKE45103.1 tRNA 2-selenouridine synthase [Oceaniovalibus guishaninsula JLT2003]
MTFAPDSLDAFRRAAFDDIIDVRSPSEYAEDHVPGAISLPVLDDAERARIGTIYVRQSAFLARKLGAALVARNAAAHIEGPLADRDGGWRPLVYCWRGGQRSRSFASILDQIGWRVAVLEGGYRTYRALVRQALYEAEFPAPVILLDGYTGTAKTELLHLVAQRDVQILDLEGMARHRGSVFGGRPADQPSQKAFESQLAEQVALLDPARPVLIEAESSKIGARVIPPRLWQAMRAAPRLTVAAPAAARAAYLAGAYADIAADGAVLDRILVSLTPLQGRDRIAAWRDLAQTGRVVQLAEALIVHHYDPRYAAQRDRAAKGHTTTLETPGLDPDALDRLADRIATEMRRF